MIRHPPLIQVTPAIIVVISSANVSPIITYMSWLIYKNLLLSIFLNLIKCSIEKSGQGIFFLG